MTPRIERDRPFQLAFAVALLFHLSALTLFSVVVRFQKTEIPYNTLALVDSSVLRKGGSEAPPGPLVTIATNPDTALIAALPQPEPTRELWPELPHRMTTGLEPTGTGLTLQKLEEALRTQSAEAAPAPPVDTWGLVSGGLRRTGEYFGQLVSGKLQERADTTALDSEAHQVRLGEIGPGVEATIEWLRAPFDRKPDIAFPLQLASGSSLGGVTSPGLAGPVTLLVRINARGEVVDALAPSVADPSGLVDAAVRAIKRYKFRPLSVDETQQDQTGTFTLEPVKRAE
ncbi:MAG: hypothetical protein HZB26_01180 [Candidatus Hydrogenedentes bacterium]|nr:hypothetical protein [Candidatus Hydrogenedentota bacterium]